MLLIILAQEENLILIILKSRIKLYKKYSSQEYWEKIFKNIDVVFHLAAFADIVPSIQEPKKYFEANVVGTYNVLVCCRKYKIKRSFIQLRHLVMVYQKNTQQMKMQK